MKLKLFLLAVSTVFALPMDAQSRLRSTRVHNTDTLPALVKQYMDSLKVTKANIDSAVVEANTNDGKYYRLFAPLTFYHGVSENMFALEKNGDEQDCTLANIYLNRPDLVRNTQRQLDLVGPVVNPYPESVTPETELAHKVVAKADDADIEAPVDIFVAKPNFWKLSGNYSLQLFQNYVSDNWYKGGESNYSMLGTVTLQANYNNKQRFRWENKLELRLGLQNSKGDTLHTVRASEDLIRYTGKVGLQATKRWYYTFQLIASTQFMRGLKSNDHTVYSNFLSPLYINPSLGMDYSVDALKGKLTGSIHLAPIAYNLTYIKDSKMASRFGVDEGKHTKYDFGSEVTLDLAWNIANNILWKTRLYGYTSYKRVLVEWENTVTFIFNKYISSNIFIYPRFDDGAKRGKHGYMQMKEFISLGFNYGF